MTLGVALYSPLKGSSYIAPLKRLEDENAILNIQNQDENFFLWSGLAALHPVNRTNMSNQEQELNVSETEFPMKLKDKPKFEKQNATMSTNLFSYEERELSRISISEQQREHRYQTMKLCIIV